MFYPYCALWYFLAGIAQFNALMCIQNLIQRWRQNRSVQRLMACQILKGGKKKHLLFLCVEKTSEHCYRKLQSTIVKWFSASVANSYCCWLKFLTPRTTTCMVQKEWDWALRMRLKTKQIHQRLSFFCRRINKKNNTCQIELDLSIEISRNR